MKNFMKQFGKALCYFLLFVGSQNLISIILQLIYGLKAGIESVATGVPVDQQTLEAEFMEYFTKMVPVIILVSSCLTLLILWIFFLIRKKKLFTETRISSFAAKYVPFLILLGISLQVLITFVLSLLPAEMLDAYVENYNSKFGFDSALTVLAQVIAAPIVEEIIFRGLMLSRLRKAMPTAAAVILSSIAFGVVHGQILWMAYAFCLGVIFCVVAIRTDSILTTILLHFTVNLSGVILSYLSADMPMALYIAIIAASVILGCVSLYFLLRKQPEVSEAEPVCQNDK